MRPSALTLRRLRSMRDEVLHNIRSHCAQVYKKPKDAEICRSAALIAAAEIADVLKEKYGIDISPTEVAGLTGDLPWKEFKKRPRWPHPSYRWERAPEEPFAVHEDSPQAGIAINVLKEAQEAQAHALRLMGELKAGEAMDLLRRAFRSATAISFISDDPNIKEIAAETARQIGKNLAAFSRVTLADLSGLWY